MRDLYKDPWIIGFGALLLILTIFNFNDVCNYPRIIDWHTIGALTGLLIVVEGIKESGVLERVVVNILPEKLNERKLALFLVLLSIFLASFLTNDVALFILVPLLGVIQKRLKGGLEKLIIFMAIAVNIGSALTPIGNPQNLYLWHIWGISFGKFIIELFPLFLMLSGVLLIFILLFFKNWQLDFQKSKTKDFKINKLLFGVSIFLLIGFIIALELGKVWYMLTLIFLVYFVKFRKIFSKIDWGLLILFIIFFLDFHLIGDLPVIREFLGRIMNSNNSIFLAGAFVSQLISNVPAAILLSKFTKAYKPLVYGVNVGGNGIIIGSLANLIALRLGRGKKLFIEFHKISLLYFTITVILGVIIFF